MCSSKKGITLIETVIAMAILTLIGGALAAIMLQASSANNAAKMRTQATELAQQNLENVRSYRSTYQWSGLSSKAPGGCSGAGVCNAGTAKLCGSDLSSCPAGVSSYVQLCTCGSGVLAESYGTWSEKGVARSVKVQEYFYAY